MLEKRESIVSVTLSGFSALLDVLRNLYESELLFTKQSFVVEVMVLPYLSRMSRISNAVYYFDKLEYDFDNE